MAALQICKADIRQRKGNPIFPVFCLGLSQHAPKTLSAAQHCPQKKVSQRCRALQITALNVSQSKSTSSRATQSTTSNQHPGLPPTSIPSRTLTQNPKPLAFQYSMLWKMYEKTIIHVVCYVFTYMSFSFKFGCDRKVCVGIGIEGLGVKINGLCSV